MLDFLILVHIVTGFDRTGLTLAQSVIIDECKNLGL